MYIVTVTFTIKKECINNFRTAIKEQAKSSLELEKNCHQFDVCYNPNQSDVFFLYEIYSSHDDFEVHLKSKHFLHFNKTITHWVTNKVVQTWNLENDNNRQNINS